MQTVSSNSLEELIERSNRSFDNLISSYDSGVRSKISEIEARIEIPP